MSNINLSPLARKPAPLDSLVNIDELLSAYYTKTPNHEQPEQRVSFGTSGHRGSSFKNSFNELHILAITQAICDYRHSKSINGPLYLGIDTHALSAPAQKSALEVLAANGVEVMIAEDNDYTPTPVISHAILTYNLGRKTGPSDGIVITPSHNPPQDGGFKYNPPNGGPADTDVTRWIENRANDYLKNKLSGVKRVSYQLALNSNTTHRHNYLKAYVDDLHNVVDMELLRNSNIKMGVDPLGGAGVNYWGAIAERYKLNLTVVSKEVDPTFRFMSVDWDGKIRMDPSSPYAMQSLIKLKDRFDIAFAADTDHDRHGIVTRSVGLLPPNHYLSVCTNYLFQNRPNWGANIAVGKTLVSSQMIDRVSLALGRKVYEVPVGFKWFVDGLINGTLGFVGEESAGATFLRFDGSVWTTDKDAFVPALLSAEIIAKEGKDPGVIYSELSKKFGESDYTRIDAPADSIQKKVLSSLTPEQITATSLAGDAITSILSHAPGNGASIGGLKITTDNGWFAARPSGTEEIYKIYAESFSGKEHLDRIIESAKAIVSDVFAT